MYFWVRRSARTVKNKKDVPHSVCCSIVSNYRTVYYKNLILLLLVDVTQQSLYQFSLQLNRLFFFIFFCQYQSSFCLPQPLSNCLLVPHQPKMYSQIVASVLLFVSSTAAITTGTAATFGVCAATTVTSTGNTVIAGRLGVSPGFSVTGFPPGVATSINRANLAAFRCEADISDAYRACQGALNPTVLTGQELAGKTLTPGAYKYATTASLAANGVLTFNALNSATAEFIIQVGTKLDLLAGSKMLLTNGAKACQVFFCSGSSVVIGANAGVNATIMAYTSVSVADAVANKGGLFALNGAVTLINDNIASCAQ